MLNNFSKQEIDLLSNYSFSELVEFADYLNDCILKQVNMANNFSFLKSVANTGKHIKNTLTGDAHRKAKYLAEKAKLEGDKPKAKMLRSEARSKGLTKWGARAAVGYGAYRVNDAILGSKE